MTKLKEEFFKILPPTIFFFVALHLVMFVRILMLEGTGVSPYSSISIAVAALIFGKSVLIADMLPFINRFPHKPLIYNIAWKTVIYLLISLVIHYLKRLVDFWRQAGGLVAGNQKLLAELSGRISGLSRSFSLCSLPCIAPCMNWYGLSVETRCYGYSSARCLHRKFERCAHGSRRFKSAPFEGEPRRRNGSACHWRGSGLMRNKTHLPARS